MATSPPLGRKHQGRDLLAQRVIVRCAAGGIAVRRGRGIDIGPMFQQSAEKSRVVTCSGFGKKWGTCLSLLGASETLAQIITKSPGAEHISAEAVAHLLAEIAVRVRVDANIGVCALLQTPFHLPIAVFLRRREQAQIERFDPRRVVYPGGTGEQGRCKQRGFVQAQAFCIGLAGFHRRLDIRLKDKRTSI